MSSIRIGFAMCGSFCTFSQVVPEFEKLCDMGYDMYPIMSEISYSTDTRFGKAENFKNILESKSQKKIISTIIQAEPIGPKNLLDILVIAPCTGNTLGKLANAITDSVVTMAAKATLRNSCPVLIAVSTNDALSASAKNIGTLLNCKNIFFVPMRQDDCDNKPTSIVADFSKIHESILSALDRKQLQPIFTKA